MWLLFEFYLSTDIDNINYCFEANTLPDRCPDCGAVTRNDKPAVRPASNNEIDELLRIRAEDND